MSVSRSQQAMTDPSASSASGGSALTLAWNKFLTAVAVFNGVVWLTLVVRSRRARQDASPTPRTLWDRLWSHRLALALVYVVACGIRGAWPRQDIDRVCMWAHPLLPPAVGRSLAYVAELCFCALVCATFVRCIASRVSERVAATVLAFNFVAQNCCTYAVLTTDQRGHVVEESIWALSAVAIVATTCYALAVGGPGFRVSPSPHASAFLRRGVCLGGAVYVAFMVLVDVPMYVRRSLDDVATGRPFLSLSAGAASAATCKVITTADSYWVEEMPWLTGYFTFAVWAMLWMAAADITPAKRAVE